MANTSDYLYIGNVVNKNSVIFKLTTLGAGIHSQLNTLKVPECGGLYQD